MNTGKEAHTGGTKSSLSDWRIPSIKRGVAGDIMNILVNYALWFKMGTEINSYYLQRVNAKCFGHGPRHDQTRMI